MRRSSVAKKTDPFVSNQETGVYFWCHSDADGRYQFSNHPHALLSHYCPVHRWYSDAPCRAEHSMEFAKQMPLPEVA